MAANINITIKWSGKEYVIDDVASLNTVKDLKEVIHKQTNVKPERQKLLGLKLGGKPPSDDVKLLALSIKPGVKIMMMGTQEETLANVIKPPKEVTDNNVVDDFDIEEEEVAIQHREEFLAKIKKRVDTYKVEEINPPREGKKLLVLDIDYTLFDHRSSAENGFELMRPYLHEFLTAVYPHYDIVIWSATGMKWIKAKMQELGVSNNGNYKLSFMLDSGAMITVHTEKYGVVETKPLAVIWGKYSQYSSKNSIIFDDLRRNFLMNPSSGLKIRPFKNAHANRDTDRELLKLSRYLLKIKDVEDFETLNHSQWEK
ncbi:ubiquitin-like domain-containing CTD phosphatase 1 isoform X1 [Hydractinia symbiolongicarpus]|uniref:ubiquitin-like domain-containing CTD phosphatase 1 isoform X1 n=1 Tax=Hydractinia symbiolongicarpus TaxID=13093 RepID=UPI00254F23DC|nr:ubiquitin-like domain-containing CTD phosphatase 1 isoform X1 [Hydractinia symbiolongicarpus]